MKKTVAFAFSVCLVWTHAWAVVAQESAPPDLAQLIAKPYLDLLDLSTTIRLTPKEVEDFKRQIEKEKETEKKRLEREDKQLKTQIEQARKQLDKLNKSASRDTEERLKKGKEESQQEKKNRPTLLRLPECDDEKAPTTRKEK